MKLFEKIKLDKDVSSQHLYIQLYKALKGFIVEGKLKKGDRLPPIRKLSEMLEVNNVTVVSSYRMLEEEKLVYKKIGSGTYVAFDLHNNEGFDHGPKTSLIEQGHIQLEKNTINFASATPSTDLFPVDDFKEVLNEVLDRDKGSAFGYQESQGYYPLRLALKEYIDNYNIITDINNIQIISGAQQGIDIIAKGLLNYGDYVMIEGPSYRGAMAVFESRGAKIIDIPLEKDGLNLQDLEKKIIAYQPKFLYMMPNFQNPTGISYSLEKKKKILEIAEKYHLLIVEDDYLSDLNFYNNENITLKSLDHKDLVIYIKSFSKILMPGLRLGFLVVPRLVYGEVLLAKHTTDISTSGLLQRALELYLKKGTWQQHIRYMGTQYMERFEAMVRSIKEYMPQEVEYTLPKGGVNFWFKLPKGLSSKELYEMTVKQKIVFAPGHLFFLNNKETSYFRLSTAAVNVDEIKYGIKELSDMINVFMRKENHHSTQTNEYTPIL
ncbi:PLP-dependent aminotransferase family protein [Clostridium formicaceticum]|uniref:2-aminoadipate transaminase n=1 Tax=Clostridium formicaceticum TaxID=1497 RepID=A0AAC9RHG2_9CLOT|nr:PLP-dependent aminotransferase family protein [Clostridium formicaceticum]AOY76643.1 transcriptional regulator [Clostridium formicaceticum]ARE87066.1 2-aminoadipate transaminase [Clostridium formicaceticum]